MLFEVPREEVEHTSDKLKTGANKSNLRDAGFSINFTFLLFELYKIKLTKEIETKESTQFFKIFSHQVSFIE